MPTNEQRRQSAKRKLERQIVRRQERARRRRRVLTIGSAVTVVVLAIVAVGVYLYVSSPSTPAPTAAAGGGACTYNPSGQPASKPANPPDGNPPTTGTVGLTLQTSQGAIPLTLDRTQAPCAVNAVTSLAQQGFYDDTPCHRLVTQGLKVLQCGDPTGAGSGGPGYQYAEEPPKNLAPSPEGQGAANYNRGLVAMAKSSQPGSTGSQFFLVYGDSPLPPEYTVVGKIDQLGVLDKVGAGGEDDSNGPGDGKPKIPVQIQKAVLAAPTP